MSEHMRAVVVFAAALCIAAAGAYDHAGGWNDASRLATVECLVDHRTWAIDRSVFVSPPPPGPRHPFGQAASQFPYGTLDKLWINGHYFSDKSPVPAVLLAGVYAACRVVGAPAATDRPDLYCWSMALAGAGLPFAVAVLCVDAVAGRAGLRLWPRLLVTAGFAFGSLALPYSRAANNHIILLGVLASLLLFLDRIASGDRGLWVLAAGTVAGLAYTVDLGVGPVVYLGATLWAAFRLGRSLPLVTFVAASVPWIALHHALNFHIGGSFGPANANPAYFNWPGCPFAGRTLTGGWHHESVLHFAMYAADLLVGKKGYFGHNLPLVLAVPSAYLLLKRPSDRRPEVALCCAWFIGTWLTYAAGSRNYSGECLSVRWFVPLVSPGYFVLIQGLRRYPEAANRLALLTAFSVIINTLGWRAGPWSGRMVWGFWLWVVAACAVCGFAFSQGRQRQQNTYRRAA